MVFTRDDLWLGLWTVGGLAGVFTFFPFRHAERLYAAANEPKRLVEIQGRHADGFFTSETACRDALREFFVALPRCVPSWTA